MFKIMTNLTGHIQTDVAGLYQTLLSVSYPVIYSTFLSFPSKDSLVNCVFKSCYLGIMFSVLRV